MPVFPDLSACLCAPAHLQIYCHGHSTHPPTLPQMVSLLEQYLFPKWHAVLRHWLANAPDYDEVRAWA